LEGKGERNRRSRGKKKEIPGAVYRGVFDAKKERKRGKSKLMMLIPHTYKEASCSEKNGTRGGGVTR